MTKENIYDLIKAHATELVDGRFRFKKVDLKEACAELEAQLQQHSEVATVGQRSVGKSVRGGCNHKMNRTHKSQLVGTCIKCGEIFGA